jgi:hypothetical protein
MQARYVLALIFLIAPCLAFTQEMKSGKIFFKQNQIIAKYKFIKGPSNQGDSIMELSFQNEQGEPVRVEAGLGVVMFMPDMGHAGAPTKIEIVPARVGVYRISKMFFYHNGLWEIRISMRSRLGSIETNTVKYIIDGTYCYQP